jgi:hypothetical protein
MHLVNLKTSWSTQCTTLAQQLLVHAYLPVRSVLCIDSISNDRDRVVDLLANPSVGTHLRGDKAILGAAAAAVNCPIASENLVGRVVPQPEDVAVDPDPDGTVVMYERCHLIFANRACDSGPIAPASRNDLRGFPFAREARVVVPAPA